MAKKTTKNSSRNKLNISVGSRILYGKIIRVWDCPLNTHDKWVLIKNDDPRVYKSFSLYKYKDINGGDLMTFHFIPPEIFSELLSLDLAIVDNETEKCVRSGGNVTSDEIEPEDSNCIDSGFEWDF